LIKVLKNDNTLLKADVKFLETRSEILTYIAIGAGAFALGAGGYIILK
jgi:hypothetical protein